MTEPIDTLAADEPVTVPQTTDIVVDAALTDLGSVSADDLDGLLAAGERVEATLRSRLADLSG